jgi:hypothetical protein
MSGPFKMKGSGHYGHGNQKRKDGMPFVEAAKGIMEGVKAVGGMMSKKEEDTPAQYASPAKTDKKKMTAEEMQAASLAAAEKTEGITVSSKKYTDVTDEYAKKGSASTREHIASGGKVKKAADGSLKLTKSTN